MKFREYLKELAKPTRKLEQLILDVSELIGKVEASNIANSIETNPHRYTKSKLAESLISLIYEILTKDRPEGYEVAEFQIDNTKFLKKIEKFREKTPKFNSICIRLPDIIEEYSKTWTK